MEFTRSEPPATAHAIREPRNIACLVTYQVVARVGWAGEYGGEGLLRSTWIREGGRYYLRTAQDRPERLVSDE